MPTLPVQALTLHRWTLRNADRVYRLLTLQRGIIEVRVASAAKVTSKLAGHLEPFSEAQLLLARKNGPYRVAGASVIKRYWGDDVKTMQRVAKLANLAEQLVSGEQPQVQAYEIVKQGWQEILNTDQKLQDKILADYCLRLASITGYALADDNQMNGQNVNFIKFVEDYLASVLPYPFRLS
jgi:recombinational DNA repair protein (RecF pathway)